MGKIVIEENLEEFEVVTTTGRVVGVVRFNPVDSGIATRYREIGEKFQNFTREENESDEDFVLRIEKEIRDLFDYLLNQPCADIFFAEAQPMSVLMNGNLYCESVLDGIGAAIGESTKIRAKRIREKVNKYAKKYHK